MQNYKIIGGDGREYGADSLEELKSWVGDGRIGPDTLVWIPDAAVWTPAGDLPELGGALEKLLSALQTTGLIRAGFFHRLAAYLLDSFVLSGAFSLVWPLAAASFGLQEPPDVKAASFAELFQWIGTHPVFFYSQMACIAALQAGYQTLFNGRFGATLGKMALGMRILRLDGGAIGYGLAFRRWICEQASSLLFFIGYLLVLFRADRRALHDLLAGTQVVFRK